MTILWERAISITLRIEMEIPSSVEYNTYSNPIKP
jgi:hypothetical protein